MRWESSAAVLLFSGLWGCTQGATDAAGSGGASAGGVSSGGMGSAAAAGSNAAAAATGGSATGGGATGGTTTAGSSGSGGAPASTDMCADLLTKQGPESQWVRFDEAGKLVYEDLDPNHNRILDYSHAGYRGGGVKLPEVAVQATLGPSGGDDTDAIQAALDEVAALPLVDGARGAVLLEPGTYQVAGTLTIEASGVVLRGSGSKAGGTRLELTGEPHQFLAIQGSGSWKTEGDEQAISDAYVPVGARTLNVADASGFQVGDGVLVQRPVTAAWVHLMEMDTLVRDGAPQTWLGVGSVLRVDRVVAAVAGNELTLDVPLSDSYDAEYLSPPGASVVRYSYAGRISEVGVEHLRVAAPDTSVAISQAQFTVLGMTASEDAWVRDVATENTVNSVKVGAT